MTIRIKREKRVYKGPSQEEIAAEKNPGAQAMANARWAKTTPEERSKQMRKLARKRWGDKKTGKKK